MRNTQADGPVVQVEDVTKTYSGGTGVRALDRVSVAFAPGTFTATVASGRCWPT